MIVRELINMMGVQLDKNQLSKAEGSIKKLGENFTKVGKTLSLSLTAPLTAFAGLSVRAFNKQAQAMEQVRIGVESTGKAAGRSVEDLDKLARKLQAETMFGDEEILAGATSQLLTFTNIAGEQFDKTQSVVLDVATRLAAAKGGAVDLTSTSLMLGKALNDPVANLGALSRAGIQFSKEQKELVKDLWETGREAEAQDIILKELEAQYGGSAKAAASVGTGGLIQLKNLFGDFMEVVGEVIWNYLSPLVERLKVIVNWLLKLDERTIKTVVLIGALAAAIGPLMVAIGLLIKLKLKLNAVMAANPIFLIIMGVAAAIAVFVILYVNIKRITGWFSKLWSEGGKLTKILMLIAAYIFLPITMLIALIRVIRLVIDNFDIVRHFGGILWDRFLGGARKFLGTLRRIKDSVMDFLSPVFNFFGKIWDLMKRFDGFVAEIFEPMLSRIKGAFVNAINWLIDKYNVVARLIGREVAKIRLEEDSAKAERDVAKTAAGERRDTNVEMNNDFHFSGGSPTDNRQAKRVMEQAAGTAFNIELKKILVSSGGM